MKSPRFAQMRCIYRGDKLHAQTSNLWTLCAALNESYPISLRPSGLTSWTFIVTNRKRYEVTCDDGFHDFLDAEVVSIPQAV